MENAALILIDWQQAFDNHDYWGGNRNNPSAEMNGLNLLKRWRDQVFPIFNCIHDSQNSNSLLRLDRPGGRHISGFEPKGAEPLIVKNVNSCFIGTDLEAQLHKANISNLVICGLTTNHCVSTTTRMAGNLGFNVRLVGDACATFDRKSADGNVHKSEVVHEISLANLHEEFCIVTNTAKILSDTS